MVKRRPLVDRSAWREVDVRSELGVCMPQRGLRLGRDIVRGGLQYIEPWEVFAGEEFDGWQIRKQKSFRQARIHATLAEEQIATGIVSPLVRARMLATDGVDFPFEIGFELACVRLDDLLCMPQSRFSAFRGRRTRG